MALFDRLTRISASGKDVEPSLASEYTVSSDGTVWTFTLREGVKFHDGVALTAADVKYSLERQINPKLEMEAQSLYAGLGIVGTAAFVDGSAPELVGVKAVDDKTVSITLEQPNGSLPFVLAQPMASIIPVEYTKRIGSKEFETAPVGTGPFSLAEYDPSRGMKLLKNPSYWDSERAAKADGVDWEFGVDASLATLRIERGELDLYADALRVPDLQRLRADPAEAGNVVSATQNNTVYITLSVKNPQLADVRVRRAVSHAIDREKTVRALGGLGQVADGGIFSPLSPYYQEGLTPQYNPDTAKALLAEAGLSNGFDVKIYVSEREPHFTVAQNVQADLRAIGIRVELVKNPSASGAFTAWQQDNSQIWVSWWELSYPHGSYIIDSAFTEAALKSGCCNFSSWVDLKLEDLAKQARLAVGQAEQVRLYKEIDRLVIGEQVLWVPIVYPGIAYQRSSRLQGYQIPNSPNSRARIFADYWLAT